MAGGVFLNTSGLRRVTARIERLSPANLAKVQQRAVSSMRRSLKAEAARAVSEVQLNLSARAIAPYIEVKDGKAGGIDYVSVTASKARLPLSAYKPKFSKRAGSTVVTWKDSAPVVMPHAFRRGREAWQRIPDPRAATASGLVGRLPIVLRKGPSLKRALEKVGPSQNDHGREEVVNRLMEFGRAKLAAEIQRLLQLI